MVILPLTDFDLSYVAREVEELPQSALKTNLRSAIAELISRRARASVLEDDKMLGVRCLIDCQSGHCLRARFGLPPMTTEEAADG
jgi:hypothetical protein